MVLMPESGCNVVKLESYLGNAGLNLPRRANDGIRMSIAYRGGSYFSA